MKVKTTVTDLTRAELISLLAAATYHSDQFHIYVAQAVRNEIGAGADDCREDVWASALLGGHFVWVYDLQADGCAYGNLTHCPSPDDKEIIGYRVHLSDIKRGLSAAIDGSFTTDNLDRKLALDAWRDFAADTLDNAGAETLMQVIVFNEIIYA